MSDPTARQSLNLLHQINANLTGRNIPMGDKHSAMMLEILIQINGNLLALRGTLERMEQDGMKVRTQESHA